MRRVTRKIAIYNHRVTFYNSEKEEVFNEVYETPLTQKEFLKWIESAGNKVLKITTGDIVRQEIVSMTIEDFYNYSRINDTTNLKGADETCTSTN